MAKTRDYRAVLKGIATFGGIALAIYLARRGVLSKDFTRADLVRSATALRLGIAEQFEPPGFVIRAARRFAQKVLQPVANYSNLDIRITSWWRAARTNAAIPGSVSDSRHLKAEAVDWTAYKMGMRVNGLLAQAVIKSGVPFTKMILEYGSLANPQYIHLAYTPGDNRQIVLRKTSAGYSTLTHDQVLSIAA